MEASTMHDTNPFRVFVTTTFAALAVSTSANAAYINTSGVSTVESDASVDATTNPMSAPDDATVPFFDQVDSEVSSVFSSGSSYAGQSVLQTNPDTFSGAGSVVGDAIAFFPEGATGDSISDFVFEFEVDAPTKLDLTWALRANMVGDDSHVYAAWAFNVNGSPVDSVAIDGDVTPTHLWEQFDTTSFQLTPGNTYAFTIGVSGNTAAGGAASPEDFYGSYGAQWQFTLSIPAPSTLAALAPFGVFCSTRRRRA